MSLIDNFNLFISAIVNDYYNARVPVCRNEKLSRGTLRVVSALAEERLAELLVTTYPAIEHIYIDQRMSNEAVSIRKPDIAVVVRGQVRLLIDVKMDLNWKREDLPKIIDEAEKWLEQVVSSNIPLNVNARREEDKREWVELPFGSDCKCIILVIAGDAVDPRNVGIKETQDILRVHTIAFWPGNKHPNQLKRSREQTIEMLQRSVQDDALLNLQKICDQVFISD